MDQFLHRDHKMRSPRINRTTIWLSVAIFPWKNTNFAQLVGHFRHPAVGGVPETVSGHNTMPSLFISQSISPSTVSSRPHWEVRSRNTPTAVAPVIIWTGWRLSPDLDSSSSISDLGGMETDGSLAETPFQLVWKVRTSNYVAVFKLCW